MNRFTAIAVIATAAFFCISCSEKPVLVHVNNQNDRSVSVIIKSQTGSTRIVRIDSVAGRTISPYIEISPTNGGTISASRDGSIFDAVDFYALGGNSYAVVLSSGDDPVLSWEKE